MYRKILSVATFAFSLALSQATFADSMGCGEHGFKHQLQSLNLTDAQKEKIKPILEQLKSSAKDSWSQIGAIDTQISQQVESANMDQSAAGDLVDKKTKLIGDMMKAKLTAKNQIINILTADQKTKLHNAMKKREEKLADKLKKCDNED